jgi:hypothetical protein
MLCPEYDHRGAEVSRHGCARTDWSRHFENPITLPDGRTLSTFGDKRDGQGGHIGWIYWNKPGLNLLASCAPALLRRLRQCRMCMYGHINTIGIMIGPMIVHRLRIVG